MRIGNRFCFLRGPCPATEATGSCTIWIFIATVDTVPNYLGFRQGLDIFFYPHFLADGALENPGWCLDAPCILPYFSLPWVSKLYFFHICPCRLCSNRMVNNGMLPCVFGSCNLSLHLLLIPDAKPVRPRLIKMQGIGIGSRIINRFKFGKHILTDFCFGRSCLYFFQFLKKCRLSVAFQSLFSIRISPIGFSGCIMKGYRGEVFVFIKAIAIGFLVV